ncbi:hypothetical protein ABID96_003514 [Bacillus sp. OAE603]
MIIVLKLDDEKAVGMTMSACTFPSIRWFKYCYIRLPC